jgi:hypothetical protein
MPMSKTAWEAWRAEFRSFGPRHRNIDRWENDLGWRIEPDVADAYLAPEVQ